MPECYVCPTVNRVICMLVMHIAGEKLWQVAWQKGSEVQQLWRDVVVLLGYPHVWIRKASGRLLGLLLSSTKLG